MGYLIGRIPDALQFIQEKMSSCKINISKEFYHNTH